MHMYPIQYAQICKLYAANMQSYTSFKRLYAFLHICAVLYAIICTSSYAIICIFYTYTSTFIHPLHAHDYVSIMHVSTYISTTLFFRWCRLRLSLAARGLRLLVLARAQLAPTSLLKMGYHDPDAWLPGIIKNLDPGKSQEKLLVLGHSLIVGSWYPTIRNINLKLS